MEFPVPLSDERIVSQLPAGTMLPGIPEATHVLCGGGGMALRALAIGIALLSAVIVLRVTYRVARSPRSVADSMTSLLAATLPVVGYLWLSTQTTIGICFLSPPLVHAIIR